MSQFKLLFLTPIVVCIFVMSVNAAPITPPSSVKEMKGRDYIHEYLNIAFLAGGEADIVDERKFDKLDAEAEAIFYTLKVVLSFLDKVDIYALLGQAQSVEYKAQVSGADIKYELEDEIAWGVGLNALLYEWERFGIKFFGDIKYRTIEDADYESVTLEGVEYGKESLTQSKEDATWEEWQAALSVAKKFEYIMPYIGIKYSDVDASAKVTLFGITYDLGSVNSGENIGAFVGCSITPIKDLSIDLEARFIDEEAFTAAVVHQF